MPLTEFASTAKAVGAFVARSTVSTQLTGINLAAQRFVAAVLAALIGIFVLPGNASAANAASSLAPRGTFEVKVPGTVSFNTHDAAFARLEQYATTNPTTSTKKWATALTHIPNYPNSTGEFDLDNNGVQDAWSYTQPVYGDFSTYGGCSTTFTSPRWSSDTFSSVMLHELEPPSPPPRIDAVQAAIATMYRSECISNFSPPAPKIIRRTSIEKFRIILTHTASCPDGYSLTTGNCDHAGGLIPERNFGKQCPALSNGSNPINSATGNKFEEQMDFPGTSSGSLTFTRYYNSQRRDNLYMGVGWSHSYSRRLEITFRTDGAHEYAVARAIRPDGEVITFRKLLPDSTAWLTDGYVNETLAGPVAGVYTLTDDRGIREEYQTNALIFGAPQTPEMSLYLVDRIIDRSGREETVTYDATVRDRVSSVTDADGRTLTFTYDDMQRVAGITDPSGYLYSYEYDDRNNHTKVVYPDSDDVAGNSSTRNNNPFKTYSYTDPDYRRGLTAIVDENNAAYGSWGYDSLGRAEFSQHAGGADRVDFQYGTGTTNVTDSKGTTRTFTIGESFGKAQILGVTSPCTSCGGGSQAASTTYDANGRKARDTDFRNNVTDYAYDAKGLLTSRIDGFGSSSQRMTEYTWDSAYRVPLTVTIRDAGGAAVRKTTFTYWNGLEKEKREEDLSVTAYAPRITTRTYYGESGADPAALSGLLKSIDGPRTDVSDITQYFYATTTDANHRVGDLIEIRNPLNQSVFIQKHDPSGRPLQVVDANGKSTIFNYHPRGWLTSTTVDGQSTTFTYDKVGQLDRVTLPTGAWFDYDYDGAHRLTDVRDDLGNLIHYDLDLAGNHIGEQVKDPAGTLKRDVDRVYNSLNQLQKLIGGMGQTTSFTYDANGDLARIIDPRDPAPATPTIYTENLYDALNRVRQTRNAAGNNTTTTYDIFDNPRTVTDPRGVITTYAYNGFGEMTQQVSPDSGTTTYQYDKAGNRTQQTDARGVVTNYQFDALNRLTLVDYPADTDTVMVYDEVATGGPGAKGSLTTMTDVSGTTKYQYDLRGNVTRKDVAAAGTGVTFTTQYKYSSADQLTELTYPSGTVVTYVRAGPNESAPIGKVTIVTAKLSPSEAAKNVLTGITYEPFGPAKSGTYGNGIALTKTRDLAGRITAINNAGAYRKTYNYDAADNVLSIADLLGGSNQTNTYDNLNRLLTSAGTGGSWPIATMGLSFQYGYDANGNRTGYSSHPNFNTIASSSNRMTATGNGSLPRNYDAAGNLIGAAKSSTEGHAYAYRNDNRLHKNTYVYSDWIDDQPVYFAYNMNYAYNGLGQRVSRRGFEGTDETGTPGFGGDQSYHYDESGHLLAQHRTAGVLYEYIYLDDEPIAFVYAGAPGGTKTLYYYHTDHLGTPRRATDQSGTVKWFTQEPSDPFDIWSISYIPGMGWETPALRFPGQMEDIWSPLFYNYYRDYEPKVGRYAQADPIGLAGGVNPYTYGNNNPLTYVDPTGEDAVTEGIKWGWNIGSRGGIYSGIAGAAIGAGAAYAIGTMCPENGKCEYSHYEKAFQRQGDPPRSKPDDPKESYNVLLTCVYICPEGEKRQRYFFTRHGNRELWGQAFVDPESFCKARTPAK